MFRPRDPQRRPPAGRGTCRTDTRGIVDTCLATAAEWV